MAESSEKHVQGHDAAISFLVRDAKIAGELAGRLEQNLQVFFFPHAQEELAGTDGLESMRQPFLGARVSVVLYRAPWGETPWTRVEETAIKDRCLNHGWGSLIFVQLDKTGTLPKWLPETHVRYSLEDYGIDGLVGAIKARVQEAGGVLTKPDALAHARRVQRDAELLSEKKKLFRDRAWIQNTVHGAAKVASQTAIRIALEGGTTWTPPVRAGAQGMGCVLTDYRVSTIGVWRQVYANDISQSTYSVVDFAGPVGVPGEKTMFVFEPTKRRERKFLPELSAARELVWVEAGRSEHLTPEELGNVIASSFFELVDLVNRGEIEVPFG